MSIEVNCVECNSSHHVNDRLAGRSVRCPSCDAVVAVPEKTAAMEVQATPVADDGMQQSGLKFCCGTDYIPLKLMRGIRKYAPRNRT